MQKLSTWQYFFSLVCTLLMLAGCFFAPSMNLSYSDRPIYRSSQINNIRVDLFPMDQYSVESELAIVNDKTEYRLGSLDMLSISVWGHPEFNSTNNGSFGTDILIDSKANSSDKIDSTMGISKFRENKPDLYIIDSRGSIYLPLVGKVDVAGRTLDQARDKIQAVLKDYVVNPNVNLRILGYRSQKIYVMGEVQQSQMLALTDVPLSLPAALEVAGWVNYTTANINQIYVLRKINNTTVRAFWLDGGSAPAMLIAQSFYLLNNDIIYVSTAGLTQFNRVIGQILPSAQTLWYTKGSLPSTAFPGVLN